MSRSDWDAMNGFLPENEVDVPRKRVTTAIRLKPHLHDALRQERSINWLVNAAVAEYVGRRLIAEPSPAPDVPGAG